MILGTCLTCSHGHIVDAGTDQSEVEPYLLYTNTTNRLCNICGCVDELRLLAAETRHAEHHNWLNPIDEHELDNCPKCRRIKRNQRRT